MMGDAILKLHIKKTIKVNMVLEMKLWEIKATAKYSDGIKYSLVIIDPDSHKKVLMDNHTPKGHHYHINNEEFDYNYTTIPQLVDDFKSLVQIHMGVKI